MNIESQTGLLPCVEIETGAKPGHAVIWLAKRLRSSILTTIFLASHKRLSARDQAAHRQWATAYLAYSSARQPQPDPCRGRLTQRPRQ
jgi:hypothetical protein